ncbi:Glutathione transporter [Erysiphe necator]|nr:Glutathione transporter [Erysiphe necator]
MKEKSLHLERVLSASSDSCDAHSSLLLLRKNNEYQDNLEQHKNSRGDSELVNNISAAAKSSGLTEAQKTAYIRNCHMHRSSKDGPSKKVIDGSKESMQVENTLPNNAVDPNHSLDTQPVILVNREASPISGVGNTHENDHFDSLTVIQNEDPYNNSLDSMVRASVPTADDTSLSVNTPRMWCLSLIFAALGSSANLVFSLRYPSVYITPVIALLLAHPLGLLWDRTLKYPDDPVDEFSYGFKVNNKGNMKGWKGLRLWLGQGRWNRKEHCCVYISSNVSFGFAFATDVIVEQTKFYNQEVGILYQLLLTLSSQILGYAFAGITRRLLVRPGAMVWPGTLMSVAMFSSLHKEENVVANGWKITRFKFFIIVWACSFGFYFLPGLLFPALSYFSVITWIWPKSAVVSSLFGVVSGLGIFPVTFDWAQIAYIGSPLLTPFWAALNVVGGLVIIIWIIAPIAYYLNFFNSSYLPILSSSVFDDTGKVYNVSKILTPDFILDRKAYEQYSRIYLPITYVLSYGLQFAALASLLTHTICWHGKDIWRIVNQVFGISTNDDNFRYQPLLACVANPTYSKTHVKIKSNVGSSIFDDDVHNRLMERYKDAPISWYLLILFSMSGVAIFVCEYYPVYLPWYGLLLAVGICAILYVPTGIIMAITNQQPSIYIICQLVCGKFFPGKPVANMIFVTYGYISSAQGIKFSGDLKLGHYMKIPPRVLFSIQLAATIVSSLTQISVLNWIFANVPKICSPDAPNGFTCPIAKVHFNGSILWGVVGPKEFFGVNATYRNLIWCFPIGATFPVIFWLYSRRHQKSIISKVNFPVFFGSLCWIPPATGFNFSVWALVCYVFNHIIKNRYSRWWAKYTMTLSAALDSGMAFGLVVIFFGFVFTGISEKWSWWGTTIYKQGCDWAACSYRTLPPGGHFDS